MENSNYKNESIEVKYLNNARERKEDKEKSFQIKTRFY